MKQTYAMLYRNLSIFLITTCLATACNLPRTAAKFTPTLGVTQAYQTIEARLTQEAAITPTLSPSPKPTTELPTPTSTSSTATLTRAPSATSTSGGAVSACNIAAAGTPIDVTIPDDTPMAPGQTFTKIWRLVNAGTCTWTTAYTVALFSGDAMGAPTSVPLPKSVAPNESVDITIDMVAPTTPGTYQGNWKLRDASNEWFGIGPAPGSPFWVRIIVVSGGTTITPGTPTLTLTIAPTSIVQASGARSLLPTDRINLDNGKQNPSAGEDLLYDFNIKGKLQLAPRNGALIAYYGESQPSKENCQGVSLDTAPLLLEDLSKGVYLCYQTDAGRWGWLLFKAFDELSLTLTIEFLTWSAP